MSGFENPCVGGSIPPQATKFSLLVSTALLLPLDRQIPFILSKMENSLPRNGGIVCLRSKVASA